MRLTRPTLGLVGIDRAAGQDQLERARLADQARQALRAAIAGNEAELDLRQAEPRGGGGEAEGAGERQLEPAAEGIAVDERDRQHRQAVELGKDRLPEAAPGAYRGQRAADQFLDVGAGAERPVAGAGDQQAARIGRGDLVEAAGEIAQQREGQRVERLRPVERDEREFVEPRQL